MSNGSFTETTSTGWFGRIGNSIKGILIGLVLIVIAVPVLFMNEGRAVKTRKSLEEGNRDYVTISVDAVDSAQDGKLVYLMGPATTENQLRDPEMDITADALKLRRTVEMYQWKEKKSSETKKKLGGGEETVTTYSYVKEWSSKPINSSNFKKPAGHENPKMPLASKTWTASPIKVGAYQLSKGLVRQIDHFTTLQPEPGEALPEQIAGRKLHATGSGFYLGKEPATAAIGDSRITYQVALPGEVSVLSKLRGNSFEPFTAKAGGKIEMLSSGNQSADSMFAAAHASNRLMTWLLRGGGALLMFIGFSLVFKPLSVLADVLPIAGSIVGVGTNLVALLLAIPISLAVISSAWIYYRPLIGIPLLAVAVSGFVVLIRKILAQRKRQAGRVAA